MANEDLRLFVEAMIRGEFRLDDIIHLLMYVRDRAGGRQSVREIGDFCAHRNDRNKGPITDEARDFFTHTKFIMGHVINGTRIDPNRIPHDAIDAARANLRRIDSQFLRGNSAARNKSDGKRFLESFINKLSPSGISLYSMTSSMTTDETSVWDCLINTMVVKPLFTGNQFFGEFCTVLVENKLLEIKEMKYVQNVKNGIILFAVSIMHLSNIIIENKYSVKLMASGKYQDDVGVDSLGLVPAGPGKCPTNMAIQLFDSNIATEKVCDEELRKKMFWEFPLEVTQDQTLRRRR